MEAENFEPTGDFYFWAASNASMDTFPSNKPQKFKNKLAQSMNLSGNWEVALCELYYPNNYHFNYGKIQDPALFSFVYRASNGTYDHQRFSLEPKEQYASDDDLASEINTKLKTASIGGKHTAQLIKNKAGKWELSSEMYYSEIILENRSSQELFWQLGFQQLKYDPAGYAQKIPAYSSRPAGFLQDKDLRLSLMFFDEKGTKLVAPVEIADFSSYEKILAHAPVKYNNKIIMQMEKSDLRPTENWLYWKCEVEGARVRFANRSTALVFGYLGFAANIPETALARWNILPIEASDSVLSIYQRPALFIYCDKIEYQLVGDTRAPLLTTVPVELPGKHFSVWHSFQRLTYVPVRRGYISDLEIAITDDRGEHLQFKGGKVLIKLHFRKQRQ